jgi:thiosulfate/3-mercaptopyruvate sulfurtransferase
VLHGEPTIAPIITAEWLDERAGGATVVDVRWFMNGADAREHYRSGHLPGALFVDLDVDLAGPPSRLEGRHPLPSPEVFAEAMSRVGIRHDDTIVAYDQGHGGFAARLVWMLRITGHEAALLDGGLAGWAAPLQQGEIVRAPSDFEPRPWPAEWLVDIDEVDQRSKDGSGILVDSRSPDRYRGDAEPVDARAGHVPRAINLPFSGNLDDEGRFLSVQALGERFRAAGIGKEDEVVVYCGSGVTACHNLLAMEAAGLQARLYPGSWSQWSGDPDRDVATGDEDPAQR